MIAPDFVVNDGLVGKPKYNGMLDCTRQIYRTHGFTGFYQGVVPNVWGAGLSWGLYFFL